MAKEYKISIPAHPSIYEPSSRELQYCFYEPSTGINSDTGLLLVIQGYNGENYDSDIYKMLNMTLADKYNMVTIQSNYFGYEFMQKSKSVNFQLNTNSVNESINNFELQKLYNTNGFDADKFIDLASKCTVDTAIIGYENMNEALSYFNDMGIMQALDNLNAILTTIEILKENGYVIDYGKIISYGESHGAYICYLCNIFAPHLFSAIIDNSAWLYPNYLKQGKQRKVLYQTGNLKYGIVFDYIASKISNDYDLLYLPLLYKKHRNNCKILAFHGQADSICSCPEKENFCKLIPNCQFIKITDKDIDGDIFESNDHCFGTNVLRLFSHIVDNNYLKLTKRIELSLPSFEIKTKQYVYSFDYSTGVPLLNRTST